MALQQVADFGKNTLIIYTILKQWRIVMLLKDFRIKTVSAIAVIVVLLAGFFNQTKDSIPFQPGEVALDNSGKQIMELSKNPNRMSASQSKQNSPKEAEFIITNTDDQYVTEGQRIISPDIKMRDGFHLEIWNKTTTTNNHYH